MHRLIWAVGDHARVSTLDQDFTLKREVDQIVVVYSFDLRTNEIATTNIPNQNAGREHVFTAYRIAGVQPDTVSLRVRP